MIDTKTNEVVNIVLADPSTDSPPEGYYLVSIEENPEVKIGCIYHADGNYFTFPLEPDPVVGVPDFITPRQARLMLLSMGMLGSVEEMISTQDEATKISWEYSTEFRRENPLLASLAKNIGMTEEQIDNFFIEASRL